MRVLELCPTSWLVLQVCGPLWPFAGRARGLCLGACVSVCSQPARAPYLPSTLPGRMGNESLQLPFLCVPLSPLSWLPSGPFKRAVFRFKSHSQCLRNLPRLCFLQFIIESSHWEPWASFIEVWKHGRTWSFLQVNCQRDWLPGSKRILSAPRRPSRTWASVLKIQKGCWPVFCVEPQLSWCGLIELYPMVVSPGPL